jgi:membrane associated rhomboid family serine protease
MLGRTRMIPLRDTNPRAGLPTVNWLLIAANVVVFAYEVSLGPVDGERFVVRWGLTPVSFSVATLFTSMFLHGGVLHLLGNMLFLHIFGDNVEDRLGHLRYAGFYLACGVAAGLAQTLSHPGSGLPMVGASGAIAGVSGAYLLFFPHARILTLVPIFFFVRLMEVPAVIFLVIWFSWQVLSGVATLGMAEATGVAFWAHVGGFVAGMAIGPILRLRGPYRLQAN